MNLKTCDGQFIEQYSHPDNPNHPTNPWVIYHYHYWEVPNFETGNINTNVFEIDSQYVTGALETFITLNVCDENGQNCYEQLVYDELSGVSGRRLAKNQRISWIMNHVSNQ